MTSFVEFFCVVILSLNVVQSSPDHIPTGGLAIATGPPSLGDSAVHYAYNRHYDYGHHHVAPVHIYDAPVHSYDYGHAHHGLVDHFGIIHPVHGSHGHEVVHNVIHDGYGYGHVDGAHVKHGYKHNHLYSDHGYEHEVKHEHHYAPAPHYSGYVPAHGHGAYDHGVGYAHGYDAIGHFDQHTGPFGPFGFYANYYHD